MPVTKINNFNVNTYPKDTIFVLDTNVLYFVHSGYVMPTNAKSLSYSNVIQTILSNGYSVAVSALTIQELLHLVEKKEHELYCSVNSLSTQAYTKKAYRQDATQRSLLKSKLSTILSELSPYKLDDGEITVDVLNRFSKEFDLHTMDPIDYVLINGYDAAKTVFVSDDRDFQSNSSLCVLTA